MLIVYCSLDIILRDNEVSFYLHQNLALTDVTRTCTNTTNTSYRKGPMSNNSNSNQVNLIARIFDLVSTSSDLL